MKVGDKVANVKLQEGVVVAFVDEPHPEWRTHSSIWIRVRWEDGSEIDQSIDCVRPPKGGKFD